MIPNCTLSTLCHLNCVLSPSTVDVTFDVDEEHKLAIKQNLRSKVVLEKSLDQHSTMCVYNDATRG
jgi:hypothetical protein